MSDLHQCRSPGLSTREPVTERNATIAWVARAATALFPVWVLAAGAVALVRPAWFTWVRGPFITWGLAVIMLGMGITLTFDDFRRVFQMPRPIAIGFVGQYAIMPTLGWFIARTMKLEPAFAVGLILVACCPGGTASNVVTYLAGADVALSVVMTLCSTLAAVVMTPLLTRALAGHYVPVDALALLLSTAQIVLVPVLTGVVLNRYARRVVRPLLPIAPLVSVVVIVLICAGIIGASAKALRESGVQLVAAVLALHIGGFGFGYAFSRLLGGDVITHRTISIEVGMQNSGLGVALARAHFPSLPMAPLPGALSATFHSVIGSVLAGYWRWRGPVVAPPSARGHAPHAPNPAGVIRT